MGHYDLDLVEQAAFIIGAHNQALDLRSKETPIPRTPHDNIDIYAPFKSRAARDEFLREMNVKYPGYFEPDEGLRFKKLRSMLKAQTTSSTSVLISTISAALNGDVEAIRLLGEICGFFVIDSGHKSYVRGSPTHEAAIDMTGVEIIDAFDLAERANMRGYPPPVIAGLVRNTFESNSIKKALQTAVLPASGAGGGAPSKRG